MLRVWLETKKPNILRTISNLSPLDKIMRMDLLKFKEIIDHFLLV